MFCTLNSQREGRSLPRQGRDHLFQWNVGISVGFSTETTGSLRNPETRRGAAYPVIYVYCICHPRLLAIILPLAVILFYSVIPLLCIILSLILGINFSCICRCSWYIQVMHQVSVGGEKRLFNGNINKQQLF